MKRFLQVALLGFLSLTAIGQNSNAKSSCDMINTYCPIQMSDEVEFSSIHCYNLLDDYAELTYRYTIYESGDAVQDALRKRYAQVNIESLMNEKGGEGFKPLKDENYIFIYVYIDKNRKEIASLALTKDNEGQYKLNEEALKVWSARKYSK
tara:strand:- start:2458 stop:2910 length:453 start_codon:yes stop_codon:yes gene_type:complete